LGIVTRFAPDVVHIHHWHGLTADMVEAFRTAGVRTIVTLHDYFASCPLFFRLPDDATLCRPELPRSSCVDCMQRFTDASRADVYYAVEMREQRYRRELLEA